MTNPFFSIVTVTKNCEDTIIQTLNSVKMQTNEDYEHIVIDSFSDDNTYNLIENYDSKKIIKKQIKDNSCFEGLNNAYKHAKGQFIILLHSGDLFYSSKILENIKKNINKKVDIMICNCIFFNDFNKVKRVWEVTVNKLNIDNCFHIPHTGMVINSNLVNELQGYNLKYKIASDTEYILRIFNKKNINYVFFNDFLCFMKLGGLSTNPKFSLYRIKEDFEIYLNFFGKKKFVFMYIKKILAKIKQRFIVRNKEVYNKNLLFLQKEINLDF